MLQKINEACVSLPRPSIQLADRLTFFLDHTGARQCGEGGQGPRCLDGSGRDGLGV